MKITKVSVHGQANFADRIEKVVYHENYGISEEQFGELIAGIRSLGEADQAALGKELAAMAQADSEDEKAAVSERIKSFLVRHGLAIADSLAAAGIFQLALRVCQAGS